MVRDGLQLAPLTPPPRGRVRLDDAEGFGFSSCLGRFACDRGTFDALGFGHVRRSGFPADATEVLKLLGGKFHVGTETPYRGKVKRFPETIFKNLRFTYEKKFQRAGNRASSQRLTDARWPTPCWPTPCWPRNVLTRVKFKLGHHQDLFHVEQKNPGFIISSELNHHRR